MTENKRFAQELARQTNIATTNFKMLKKTDAAKEMFDADAATIKARYDNSDLTDLADSFFEQKITGKFDVSDHFKIKAFIDRVRELRTKSISQVGFKMPSMKMDSGVTDVDDLAAMIGEMWDGLAMRIRPFLNNDVRWDNLLNIATSVRDYDDRKALKAVFRDYAELRSSAKWHNACFMKKDQSTYMVIRLNGQTDAGMGSFYYFMPYHPVGTPEPVVLDDNLMQFFAGAFNEPGPAFIELDGWKICRIMNAEFLKIWMQKFEYHPDPDFNFEDYMDVNFAKWYIRYFLMYGLMDLVLVVNYISDMLIDTLINGDKSTAASGE